MKLTYLPGTTLTLKEQDDCIKTLDGIFAAGGLVLSQVTALLGVEGYSVQNWIKRQFVSPPVNKKYSRRQFCRLAIINLLKDSLSISEIVGLLSYVNGQLDDESDDIVGDEQFYEYFVTTLLLSPRRTAESFEEAARLALADYKEPVEMGKERLISALTIMGVAYSSSVLQRQAKERIAALSAAKTL
jgi:DNA-binding transcriptional MerR regulator